MTEASSIAGLAFASFVISSSVAFVGAVVNLILALRSRARERHESGASQCFYRHRAAFVLGCSAVILIWTTLSTGGALLLTSAFRDSGVEPALDIPLTRATSAIVGTALIVLNAQLWIFLSVSLSQLRHTRDFWLAGLGLAQAIVVMSSMSALVDVPPRSVVAMAFVMLLGSMTLLEIVRRSVCKDKSSATSVATDAAALTRR